MRFCGTVVIDDRVRGDAIEPAPEREPSRFIPVEILPRVHEYLVRQVFRVLLPVSSEEHESLYARHIKVIKRPERRRIAGFGVLNELFFCFPHTLKR